VRDPGSIQRGGADIVFASFHIRYSERRAVRMGESVV
jgi:hypothetical protein